ncbi:MAG: haloacid dehalogenase [Thiothrix nivea]|nr:MAG: haloacid dehalogenase [Thiothrix nivea]
MPVRCVCFDLDDTLWDCRSVITAAEQQLYHWLSCHQPDMVSHYTVQTFTESRIHYTRQHPELHHDLGQLRLNWLQSLAAETETGQDWVNEAFECFLTARNRVEFFPNVLEQLHQLQQDYLLGSITNGNADIHRVGLGTLFQFSHNSATAGVSKPDPLIFEQAVTMAGVKPEEMVYVGDDPEKDIMGASRAGLRTIWYNPSRQALSEEANPDAIMESFNELVKLVHSL